MDRNLSFTIINVKERVALRKESVDRNFHAVQIVIVVMVALRKESVDRNISALESYNIIVSRSPQGERG